MKRLLAIDERLIDLTQDAYLWLYDRTGIYIATIAVAMMLVAQAIVPMDWVRLALTGFLVMLMTPLYIMQMIDAQAAINAHARFERTSGIRYSFLMIMLVLMPSPDPAEIIHSLLLIIPIGYLRCVQIRDREPKEFFPSRQPVGASA